MRIAAIGLCDPGYSEELAQMQHEKAILELQKTFSEIFDLGLQADEFKSSEAVKKLAISHAENPIDAIFLVQVAWSRPAVLLQVVRQFKQIPMVIYSPGSPIENGIIRSIAPAAGATATLHILRRHGIKYKYVYSEPAKPIAEEDFLPFVKAASVLQKLKGTKIGMISFNDMRLQNMGFDVQEVHERFGIEIEAIDMLEIEQKMTLLEVSKVDELKTELTKKWNFQGKEPGTAFDKVTRFYLVVQKIIEDNNYKAFSIRCPTGVGNLMGITPCLIGCLLGRKLHFVCENDVPGMITQMILGGLSNQITTYWEYYELYPEKILFGCCGFSPECFLNEPLKVRTLEGFITGMGCCSTVNTGHYTIARIGKDLDGKYCINLTDGEASKPPVWYEDCLGLPQHPSVFFEPNGGVRNFVEKATAQHVAVTPGKWTKELQEFAYLADIKIS